MCLGGVYGEYFEELAQLLPAHFNITGYINSIASQLRHSECSSSERSSPVVLSPVFAEGNGQAVRVGQVRENLCRLLGAANVQ